MAINNITGLHAAIAAICSIDGVAGDGEIWFTADATDEQKAAAREVVNSFVDSEPFGGPMPQLTPLPQPKSILEP